jgi:hypothetical protein
VQLTISPAAKFVPCRTIFINPHDPTHHCTLGLIVERAGFPGVTVIVAEPDTLVYPVCAELAMQVADPEPEGIKTPEEVIVPPVAVHVTVGL